MFSCSGTTPVSYSGYGDTTSYLIGTVSADAPLMFVDRNCSKTQVHIYYITSVDGSENESSPISLTI